MGTFKPVVIETSREALKIFRIEHSESGKGPFSHQCERNRFASDAMVYMTEPQDMSPNIDRRGFHYAFDSMEHCMGAIQSVVLLREMGFNISVYESHEHVVLPDGQVAFTKSKAIRLETYPIHLFPFEEYF